MSVTLYDIFITLEYRGAKFKTHLQAVNFCLVNTLTLIYIAPACRMTSEATVSCQLNTHHHMAKTRTKIKQSDENWTKSVTLDGQKLAVWKARFFGA